MTPPSKSLASVIEEVEKLAGSATWPYVFAFAIEMEKKLDLNRHKGDRAGWANDSPEALLSRLNDEVGELRREIKSGSWLCEDLVGEAADIGNFAMMIADVAGGMRPRADLTVLLTAARRSQELTERPVPGPYENCTDCGRPMVWADPDRQQPVWMCPRCVSRRMESAERRSQELETQNERLREIATRLGVKAADLQEGDASLGFDLNGRTVVISGTPEDCTATRDALMRLSEDQQISRHNLSGMVRLLTQIVAGKASAMDEARSILADIEANGGLFTAPANEKGGRG